MSKHGRRALGLRLGTFVDFLFFVKFNVSYQFYISNFSVPNKGFQGSTWVNDKRHTWKQWKYGHSSLAVDGKESTNLPNCAIMDNYYVDKPVFMVDLGSRTTVSGVVIITWQGQGQGD